ncbi:nuclear transport factor 2 family protein [Nocardia sp. NPDC050799]|uniref:nuclear transport factor 2 family protein n=1 Tax=Nocardia sp. NPDC050799 TaxID=3154842 RepID=UPI003407C4B5
MRVGLSTPIVVRTPGASPWESRGGTAEHGPYGGAGRSAISSSTRPPPRPRRRCGSAAAHHSLIDASCAHFLGPARVVVDSDTATAVCESLLVRRSDDGYRVWRAGANNFRLTRTPRGRRITRRVTRALDGGPQARDLLRTNISPTAD